MACLPLPHVESLGAACDDLDFAETSSFASSCGCPHASDSMPAAGPLYPGEVASPCLHALRHASKRESIDATAESAANVAQSAEVVPGVCVGSYRATVDIGNGHSAAAPTAFVNAAREAPRPGFVTDDAIASKRFQYLHVLLDDVVTTHLASHYEEVFAFIDDALADGRTVMIYCQHGCSRSVALALAYRLRVARRAGEALTSQEALARLQAMYPKADPNWGFQMQLACDFDPPTVNLD